MVMIQGKGGYPQISLCRGLTVFFFFLLTIVQAAKVVAVGGPRPVLV